MKIAFKNFLMTLKRYKVASFLNIAGLTLAFAAFYVIASQVIYSLTYNRSLKDSERTFIVTSYQEMLESWSANSPNPISYEIADAMPEVEAIASMRPHLFPKSVFSKINEYHFEKFPYGITNCNFSITDVFNFNIIAGDIEDFNVENAIMVSRSAAEIMNVEVGGQIFTDKNGKPENSFNIAAIFDDFEENTILSNRHIFLNDERRDGMLNNNWNYMVFVRLMNEDDTDKFSYMWQDKYISWNRSMFDEYLSYLGTVSDEAQANATADIQEMIDDIKSKDASELVRLISFNDMYYDEIFDDKVFEMSSLNTTIIMIAIALIIVIVAFINFVNFFMALVPVRMKAVNICKVFGAGQGTLRWNFVFEAIGLVFIALLFALYIVFALKDSFISNYVTCSLAFSENIATIIIVMAIAILIAVVAAVYPAFYITKFNASMAVKNGFAYSKSGRNLRSILISTQFIVSMMLMIVASVFFLQYRYMVNYDLGVDKENVLTFSSEDVRLIHSGETLIHKLEICPQIKEVTASMTSFFGDCSSENGTIHNGKEFSFNMWWVRWNIFDFFKVPIVAGEGFTPMSAKKDMLINLNINQNVGLTLDDKLDDNYKLKGVTANVYNMSLAENHVNSAYYCGDKYTYYYLRLHENADVKEVVDFINSTVKEVSPHADISEIEFLNENIKRMYGDIKKQTIIIAVFALIAIVISLMGIFGIVLFETQHRRREIGIRKVYGATTENVINMFARRYAVIVVICFVVAAPIAWFVSSRWLEQFANRIAMPLWVYVLVLIVVLVVTMTIVILRSWKAANENPIDAIN